MESREAARAQSTGPLRPLAMPAVRPWTCRSSLALLAVIALFALSTPFVKLNIEPSVPYGLIGCRRCRRP